MNSVKFNVINNGFTMDKCLLPETVAAEMDLIQLQENQSLHAFHKPSKSIHKFGEMYRQVQKKLKCNTQHFLNRGSIHNLPTNI